MSVPRLISAVRGTLLVGGRKECADSAELTQQNSINEYIHELWCRYIVSFPDQEYIAQTQDIINSTYMYMYF
jgi:hypothetical protein